MKSLVFARVCPMPRPRTLLSLLQLVLLTALLPAVVQAQTSLGSVNLGSSTIGTATVTFAGAATPSSIAVVTQGNPNLDFTNATGGTCATGTAYAAAATCTVKVEFAPKFAGIRYGAVVLEDATGVVATAYLQGTGFGPQVNFPPGTQSVVANAARNGLHYPGLAAVDGSGNIYIAEWGNNRVLKETLSAGGYIQSIVADAANNGLSGSWGVAVDGSGNVYITDTNNGRVLKETLSAGGYTQSVIANAPTHGWFWPEGVAVDGNGNVYVADSYNNQVLKETLSAGSYTQSVIADATNNGLSSPNGVAVDGSGNLYIADFSNARVLKETLSAGSYTQSVVANNASNGLSSTNGVAVDSSGNVYIADTFGSRVLKETLSAGSYTQSVLADSANNGLTEPAGVAVDGSGNLYIVDFTNNQVLKEDFADPPSLTFASTAVGATSTDSPQTVTLENGGNAALTFPIPTSGNNPSISANFTLNSSGASACPVVDASAAKEETLASGASCELSISFAPEAAGALSGSLVLTDNNLSAATQSIALNGTATPGTPKITWATPAAITYGTALSSTQLNASATVAGAFAYSPVSGTVLTLGTHTLSVTFTPTDTTDYTSATATVQLVVNQATPAITWATPTAITYGTALSATQLNASSTVAGTFAYTPALGTVLSAGAHTLSVTLTPADTTDYTTKTTTVQLTVNQAKPAITWTAPTAITYGTALSAAELDASSATAGAFAYTPALGTVLTAGAHTLSVTFTPTDTTDYAGASASAQLTVKQATPVITWPAPANITSGTALSATQLDATASIGGTTIPGAFVYSPASGTVESTAGAQTLSVTFTPTDATDYATVSTTVPLNVIGFSLSGSAVSIGPGATTGNTTTITVAPVIGFTGTVNLSCAISPTAASDPATCSFSPASVVISSTAQTSTLTVSTTAATTCSSALVHPKLPGESWYAAGGATLACLLLFGLPARRRSWRTMLGVLALLVALSGGILACGGGSAGGGNYCTPNSGTTPGTYTITVTGTSGTITTTSTIALTVQ
jgi:sugar lactone lactonase YvrE